MRQLFLRQVIKHIALILGLVQCFQKMIATVVSFFDTRIVARDDHVALKDLRALIELSELEIAVTVDTGIRGPSVFVGINELADDLFLEFFLEVENVIRDAEVHADRTCVFHVI